MGLPANFYIKHTTSDCVLLEDLGPWERHLTITNDAENVVAQVADQLRGRRLEYIDSAGERTELLVKDGKFAGFVPVG